MTIRALQLGARFSLPPNSLGYCGRGTAPEKFKNCIITGNCDGVEEEISNFLVLYPYLTTIAQITSLPIFSYPVIEAFWLGNKELKKAKITDYDLLLDNFLKQRVPDFFMAELRLKKPKVFIPFHLFQILHIGVGKASGAVPFNLDSINNCMIRWGEVMKLDDKMALIRLNSLKEKKQAFVLYKKEETIPFLSQLLPELKVGDTVTVHWNMTVKILTKDEEKNLEYWTEEVLKYTLYV